MTKEERLISALIGLVRAAEGNEDLITAETDRLIIDSLATLHESALDERVLEYLMKEVKREKGRLAPSCQFCRAGFSHWRKDLQKKMEKTGIR